MRNLSAWFVLSVSSVEGRKFKHMVPCGHGFSTLLTKLKSRAKMKTVICVLFSFLRVWLTLSLSLTEREEKSEGSSSDVEPGVFYGSVITCFLLCVRNFPIEQVLFLDTCSNMAGINNNNFELFTFMNEFMLDETDDILFVLYRNNSILGSDCTM